MTPSLTPSEDRRPFFARDWRANMARLRRPRGDGEPGRATWAPELAAALVIAVAVGMFAAGGTGRAIEAAVLVVAAVLAAVVGWPGGGHAAIAATAIFLILETLFGRLHDAHLTGLFLLTPGVLAAVLAAGTTAPRWGPRLRRFVPHLPLSNAWAADRWADTAPGTRRLPAGTLEYEVERARRTARPLSLLEIRPDGLDVLTDTLGDSLPALPRVIAATIENTLREIDIVSGVGGDMTFEVVLPETGPEGARSVAERLRLRIGSVQPDLVAGLPIELSVSVGAATYPADGADALELTTSAERALIHAAGLGGNRTVLHSLPPGAPPGWGMGA